MNTDLFSPFSPLLGIILGRDYVRTFSSAIPKLSNVCFVSSILSILCASMNCTMLPFAKRMDSFDKISHTVKYDWATAGFYYHPNQHEAVCFHCGVSTPFSRDHIQETPFALGLHKILSPDCSFQRLLSHISSVSHDTDIAMVEEAAEFMKIKGILQQNLLSSSLIPFVCEFGFDRSHVQLMATWHLLNKHQFPKKPGDLITIMHSDAAAVMKKFAHRINILSLLGCREVRENDGSSDAGQRGPRRISGGFREPYLHSNPVQVADNALNASPVYPATSLGPMLTTWANQVDFDRMELWGPVMIPAAGLNSDFGTDLFRVCYSIEAV